MQHFRGADIPGQLAALSPRVSLIILHTERHSDVRAACEVRGMLAMLSRILEMANNLEDIGEIALGFEFRRVMHYRTAFQRLTHVILEI